MARRDELGPGRVGRTFDVLVEHPNGLTVDEVAYHLDVTRARAYRVLRQLRKTLADQDDTLALVCDPQGQRERWCYRLLDGAALVDPEQTVWMKNRVGDMVSRIETLNEMAHIAVVATKGNTRDGRIARLVKRHLGRLLEDVSEVQAIPEVQP